MADRYRDAHAPQPPAFTPMPTVHGPFEIQPTPAMEAAGRLRARIAELEAALGEAAGMLTRCTVGQTPKAADIKEARDKALAALRGLPPVASSPTRRGSIEDAFPILFVLVCIGLVGLAFFAGVEHKRVVDARVPVNPATVLPGQVVHVGRDGATGTVLAVSRGGPEEAPTLRVRFEVKGVFTEATFLASELMVDP